MTKLEFQDWLTTVHTCGWVWQRDLVNEHNRALQLFAHKGSQESGVWVEIKKDGLVTLGTYTDAFANIGDALFRIVGRHQCRDGPDAITRLGRKLGSKFVDLVSTCR